MDEFDPIAQFRAAQAAEIAKQQALTHQQEATRQQEESRAKIPDFMERFRRFMIHQGSPGLSGFEVITVPGYHETPIHRTGLFGRATPGEPVWVKAETRKLQGWQIAEYTIPNDMAMDQYKWLILCPNGSGEIITHTYSGNSWVNTAEPDDVFNPAAAYPNHITQDLLPNVMPGIAQLVVSLGLQWDGQ